MSFNGSGTFVINSTGQPVVANTVISSTVFSSLTADLATGLSTCITKDGQTTPTANIPMGTYKLTGLGNGTAATDSATVGQVQFSTTKLVSVSGTDTITGTMSPALTAYAAGQMFYFVAAATNTGAVTLNIDGLGARNVTRDGSTALVAGDLVSGEVIVVVYDGTRFQAINPNAFTNLTVSGTATLSGGTANGVAYLNGSKQVATGSALVFDGTNLGVGTASPATRLDVTGAFGTSTTAVSIFNNTAASASNIARLDFRLVNTFGGNERAAAIWGLNPNAAGNNGGALVFGVSANGTATTPSEVARFDQAGNLGVGTASPAHRLSVNGASSLGGSTNSCLIQDGIFAVGVASISANSGASLHMGTAGANSFNFYANNIERFRIESNGSLYAGRQLALATTATDGFLYVPSCAGVPTGTPTAVTGMVPIVVDTTNNRWYFYSGGAWRDAGP